MKNSSDYSLKGLTAALCKNIIDLKVDHSSDKRILVRGRQVFTDAIAVAVAGAKKEKPPSLLAANAKESGGFEQASLIGFGFKTSVSQAALINGASMHVLDYGPMWNPPNHQLSTCLPAILALAEHYKLDGSAVFSALIKGIETMSCLRGASRQTDLNKVPFHPPGMVGPMGSAVACSDLLKLDEKELSYALGIAASRCGSLMANTGTYTKCLHCGEASSIGVDAALLAKKGFTANPEILECPNGYIDSFFTLSNFDAAILINYGKEFRIINPGYEIKPFPSNFGTHASINAGLDLHELINGRQDQIEKIVLTGPDFPYLYRPHPISGLDGKFSAQYTFVCALLDGTVLISSFTDERRFKQDVERLLGKIEYIKDMEQTPALGKAHIEATVILQNGESFGSKGYSPRSNHFGAEMLPYEQHLPKLYDCLQVSLNKKQAEQVIEMSMRIDELTAKEVVVLMELIR